MNIVPEKKREKTLLHVEEERLDAHNSSELKDYLHGLLNDGETTLILDLSAVRFIDSSGLGALLSGYKNANLRNCSFILIGLQSRVQSMFELTRLHRVFEIYPSYEDMLSNHAEDLLHEPDRD